MKKKLTVADIKYEFPSPRVSVNCDYNDPNQYCVLGATELYIVRHKDELFDDPKEIDDVVREWPPRTFPTSPIALKYIDTYKGGYSGEYALVRGIAMDNDEGRFDDAWKLLEELIEV